MDVLPILTKVAPLLASVITGPIGGMVTTLVCSFLGIKHEDLSSYIANPDNEIKLKEFETQYKTELLRLASKNFETEVNDRESARNREIQITSLTQKRDWFLHLIASFILILYAAVQLYVLYAPDTIDEVISARLQDIVLMVVSYYFGSAHNKSQK